MKKTFLFIIAAVMISISAGAQTTVAILGYENLNGEPKYDYLGGMLLGLSLFDFASSKDITLVNRSDMEAVLYEQQLGLSGITAGSKETMEVGNMLGANYLIKGEYVFLGSDLLVTCSLIDAATGAAQVFRERGSGENMAHILNGKILEYLTGKNINLIGDKPDRSLISLQDEKPGTINFYCKLIDAEVLLDDEFIGYTTGDIHQPLVIEGVKPGHHNLRLKLYEFGVFLDYTLKFGDWQQDITLGPGQIMTIRAEAKHISDAIRGERSLVYQRVYFSADDEDRQTKEYTIDFTDRQGKPFKAVFRMIMEKHGKSLKTEGQVEISGKKYSMIVESPEGKYSEIKDNFDLLECEITLFGNASTLTISRNDIDYNELIHSY